MSKSIKYFDENFKEISLEQVHNSAKYWETIIDDQGHKLTNLYSSGTLTSRMYTIYSYEDAKKYLANNIDISFELKTQADNYNITEYFSIEKNRIIYSMRYVVDLNDNIICFKKYEDGNLAFTEKTCYDENREDIYGFIYNDDGSCFGIYDTMDDDHFILASHVGSTWLTDFTWEGFEYYKNAEPFIPPISIM
jgi:hypothetical protein